MRESVARVGPVRSHWVIFKTHVNSGQEHVCRLVLCPPQDAAGSFRNGPDCCTRCPMWHAVDLCYSKCGPSPRSVLEMQDLKPFPDVQHWHLHFNQAAGEPSQCRLGSSHRTDGWPSYNQEPLGWPSSARETKSHLGLGRRPTHPTTSAVLRARIFLQFQSSIN